MLKPRLILRGSTTLVLLACAALGPAACASPRAGAPREVGANTPARTATKPASPVPTDTLPPPTPTLSRLHIPTQQPTPITHVYPILRSEGDLIGGWFEGEWFDPADTVERMNNLETYRIYSEHNFIGDAVAAPVDPRPFGCLPYAEIQLGLERYPPDVVAVPGNWEPVLDRPRSLAPSGSVYADLIAGWLRDLGSEAHPQQTVTLLQVDLDADGVDEVLMGARYFASGVPTAQASDGEYAFLLLRVVQGAQVLSLPIVEYIAGPEVDPGDILSYRFAATMDLNGDGIMEILLELSGPGWTGDFVYALEGGVLRQVLGAHCPTGDS